MNRFKQNMTEQELNEKIQHRKQHFIDRLKERYNLIFDKYEDIPFGNFEWLIKRTSKSTVGYCIIQDKKVYLIYNSLYHIFVTALPKEVGTDPYVFLKSAFKRRLQDAAYHLYKELEQELNQFDPSQYKTRKDVWEHYKNHKYFHVICFKYKNGYSYFVGMRFIKKLITNKFNKKLA